MTQSFTQRHLRILLNTRLNFQEHLKNIFSKINIAISLLRKLPHNLPRSPLLTMYKYFIRPHLDHGNIIYNPTYDALFHQKLQSIQNNSAQALKDTIGGTSKEKLYNELGFEILEKRIWYMKLCCIFEILGYQCLKHLFSVISIFVSIYNTRNTNHIHLFKLKHSYQNSFFLSAIIE